MECNIKVVCRFRPHNQKQKLVDNSNIHQLISNKQIKIKDLKPNSFLQFDFDRIFDMNSQQKEIFQQIRPIVDKVLQGFNGTIFAYGQTASGKTHTIQGKQLHDNQKGIIPRAIQHIFSSIEKLPQHMEFKIKVSVVQLYMQKLQDLIDQKKNNIKIREDKNGIFLENVTQLYVSSQKQLIEILELAKINRTQSSTNMNQRSSRSHMIFSLSIYQNNLKQQSAKKGKLAIVDLAGSQRVNKAGVQGKLLEQTKKINISLIALSKVITALSDGKSTHVPYRDSKLTRMLQESLGGNSMTSLIITCSPNKNNLQESISTLRFGTSAKNIKNKAKINKQYTIGQLKVLLQKKEKTIKKYEELIKNLQKFIKVDLNANIPYFANKNEKENLINNQSQQISKINQKNLIECNAIENNIINLNQQQKQQELLIQQQQTNNQQYNLLKMQFNQLNQSYKKYQNINNQLLKEIDKNEEKLLEMDKMLIQLQFKNKQLIQENQQLQSIIKQIEQSNKSQIDISNINQQQININESIKLKIKQIQQNNSSNLEYYKFYQNQKSLRIKAQNALQNNTLLFHKKLNSLQQNLKQLTNSYYSLITYQNKWKVQYQIIQYIIIIRKKLQNRNKDVQQLRLQIASLKYEIKKQWEDKISKVIKPIKGGFKKI